MTVKSEDKLTDTNEDSTLDNSPKNDIEKKNSNHWLGFVFAVAVASAIAIGYSNFKLHQQSDSFIKKIKVLTDQQSILQAENIKMSAKIPDKLDKKLSTINNTLNTALKDRWYQTNDWLMLKARYYMELAVINAKWTDDLGTSDGLLEEASFILKSVPGEEISTIRQEIAKEQLAIKQVDKVDLIKILSTLSAIEKSISSMTPKSLALENKNAEEKIITTPQTWQEHLKDAIQRLNGLVIIKHNKNLSTILTPSYLALISENIRLNLQQAQWAAIERNQSIFNLTIEQTIDGINRAFDSNCTKTKAIIDKLQQLSKLNITESKPEIGEALQLLNKIINKNNNEDSNVGTSL
ncbi:MAG: uroporphyrinogen-III C-methyltransferase [Legionellaceae bacterium]|nr:uroporphyrinogen-III C-methyltransferase [Legionellaceae bacterium]